VAAQHDELGRFLRRRRQRITPDSVGIDDGGRRRTPGLRREEVAALAGISVAWYTRLEQGRKVRPSQQVLESVAKALRMNPVEREHLFRLARRENPPDRVPHSTDPPRYLVEFVDFLAPAQALLLDASATVLALNDPARRYFGTDEHRARFRYNLIGQLLQDPQMKYMLDDDWEDIVDELIAQLRTSHTRWPDDQAIADTVAHLNMDVFFARSWQRPDVGEPAGNIVTYRNRDGQPTRFQHMAFYPSDAQHLRLLVLTPESQPNELPG
jgi:transcriptional regulator with XRE-family HTH domain